MNDTKHPQNTATVVPLRPQIVPAATAVLNDQPLSPHYRPIPDYRTGYTCSAIIAGHRIIIRTGEYEDGTLGELQLDMEKGSEPIRNFLQATSHALTLSLQHGVPLESIVELYLGLSFEPCGQVERHDAIKYATSIMDFVARDLAIHYLKREDLIQQEADTLA